MRLNVPNRLTILRIIMIPFFMLFIIYPFFGKDNLYISRIIAGLLFILAAVTDFLDGYIARKKHLITDFGKFMDPLADKFLIFGGLFAVCVSEFIFPVDAIFSAETMRQIFFWASIIVIFRELAVTSMRLVVVKEAGTVVAASSLGKIKTNAQIVCVSMIILEPILFPFANGVLSLISMVVMLVYTVWSGMNYLATYWKHLDTNK
ncbi:MAG: CDP-diacylglycerol--glycerol-3-phosphate 3-phosphatidyltransferase [Clostridiales bacterium GWF2_36_10]|nr:MAG: CDP-diacylglycerol--glycerol-3-phosphate 3-phosphatidyltransferase [Clostridiales bacterium GWF2_36_10]HAN21624.1 CDP-diacylglycerol--glycerol-3-phosphate 3-phosphatidyltransferase [Clostridiales bacterium]